MYKYVNIVKILFYRAMIVTRPVWIKFTDS